VGTQGVRALDVRVLLGSDHTISTRLLPQPEQTGFRALRESVLPDWHM